jgi:hypothetical protein
MTRAWAVVDKTLIAYLVSWHAFYLLGATYVEVQWSHRAYTKDSWIDLLCAPLYVLRECCRRFVEFRTDEFSLPSTISQP